MSKRKRERHTSSDQVPTVFTVEHIRRGKHWISNSYGISPAMEAIAHLQAFNALPADVRAQAFASLPDVWDED